MNVQLRKIFTAFLLLAFCSNSWSAANQLPTISMTVPAANATFPAGSNIALSATASDPDGTVAKVDFYRGTTTLIGTATSAPYTITWNNVAASSYSLTATATDNKGATKTTSPITITVVANQAPTISLNSPSNGSVFATGSNIPLSATASDSDGTIATVKFYNGATLVGTVTSAPYSFTLTNAAAGPYSISAQATDNLGATKSSNTASIAVANPPLVVMTSPQACGTTYAPNTISLKADTASQQSSIVKVDFFQGGTQLGTSTKRPYSYTWSNVGAGTYSFTARATDANGLVSTSRAVTYTLVNDTAPTVNITSPAANAVFPVTSTISLAATATSSSQTISEIDFYANGALVGAANTAPYSINFSPNAVGSFSLTAVAIDKLGLSATSAAVPISTVSDVPPTVSVTAPAAGSNFKVGAVVSVAASAADSDGTISEVDFFVNGSLIGRSTASPYSTNWTANGAGNVSLTAIALDNAGLQTTSAPVSITIIPDAPPTVSITAPASGAVVPSGQALTVSAGATDSDGTVAKVDFYANGTLIATATSAPYSVNWTPATSGSISLTAKATDDAGLTATSAAINVTGDSPPQVSVAYPTNGTVLNVGTSTTVSASGSDSDGTTVRVDFYVNGTSIGSATAPPFSVTWPGSNTGGTFIFTAKATDNLGLTTTSAPVQVTVNSNQPPSVSITSPLDGTDIGLGTPTTITAIASDSDDTIARIDFYSNGTAIGSATASPYSIAITPTTLGTVTLTAVATDNRGAGTTSAPVHMVVVSDLPTLRIVEPSAGKTFSAGAPITIGASVTDANATISEVDFYADGALVGTATTKPYVVTWNTASLGSHQLTAKATNSSGVTSVASSVNITAIGPQLTVISPVNSATVNANTVFVSGTIVAPANSGVTVNGIAATLDDNNNFYANVQLNAGSNMIDVVLTTPDGYTTNQTLTVNNTGNPVISVTADPIEGVAPLTVNLTVTNLSTTSVTVQANGSAWGTVQPGTSASSPWSFSTGVGAVPATFTASDGSGNTTTVAFVVVLHDPAALDHRFQAVFNEMNNALIAGDKASAMAMLNYSAQLKYGPVFDVLMPNYAPIAASASALRRSAYTTTYSEYAVNRMIDGVNQIYLIYFLPDANGIWRLDSM